MKKFNLKMVATVIDLRLVSFQFLYRFFWTAQ